MSRTTLALGSALLLLLAACTGGTAASAPATAAPASEAPASEAPASEAPAASESAAAGGAACAPSTEAGTVSVTIAGFAFDPASVTAKVGDVVEWTNNDSTAHTATLESDPTCTTPNLNNGESGAIVFNTAGSYAFFCKIHPNMKGTVDVS